MDSSKNETEALLRYLHGDMASSESQDWQQRLMGDESLRKRLIELSIEESALIDWAKTERASILLDDETIQTSRPSKMAKTRRAPHRVSAGWWAAAAVLIIGLTSILWSMLRTAPTGSPSLAYLVATINAEWQGVSPALHTSLPAGEYELTRGSIDLLFTDGARVSVSGPARFQLKGIRHLHLKSGNLVAQIPDEALGFIVTSPQSEVVDLGTEFGLSVSEAGNTDVHVLDGLVEVLPKQAGPSDRVMIFGGKARRFQGDSGERSTEIPIASREGLIGIPDVNELGLRLLRGSVRVAEGISRDDLVRSRSRGNWIDLVAEQQAVILTDPLDITLNAPGSYRHFNIHQTLPAGTRVDSYLLHFRPSSKKQVRGVIRFDRPIVGVICNGLHLQESDHLFGVSSVFYPHHIGPRGMEPWTFPGRTPTEFPYPPDEVILSQDRSALSINAYGNPESGYDQIRVLTLSSSDAKPGSKSAP